MTIDELDAKINKVTSIFNKADAIFKADSNNLKAQKDAKYFVQKIRSLEKQREELKLNSEPPIDSVSQTPEPSFSEPTYEQRKQAVLDIAQGKFLDVNVEGVPEKIDTAAIAPIGPAGAFAPSRTQIDNPKFFQEQFRLQGDRLQGDLSTALNVPKDKIDLTTGLSSGIRSQLSFLENPDAKKSKLDEVFGQDNVTKFTMGGKPAFLVYRDGKHILTDERGFSLKDITADIARDAIPVGLELATAPFIPSPTPTKVALATGAATLAGELIAEAAEKQISGGQEEVQMGQSLKRAALASGLDLGTAKVFQVGSRLFAKPGRTNEDIGFEDLKQAIKEIKERTGIEIPVTPGMRMSPELAAREAEIASQLPNSKVARNREQVRAAIFELENVLMSGDRGDFSEIINASKNSILEAARENNAADAAGNEALERLLNNYSDRVINNLTPTSKSSSVIASDQRKLVTDTIDKVDLQVDRLYNEAKQAAQDVPPADMFDFAAGLVETISKNPDIPTGDAGRLIRSFLPPSMIKQLRQSTALKGEAGNRIKRIQKYLDDIEDINITGENAKLGAEDAVAVSRGRGTGEYDLEFPEGPNVVIVKSQVEGARGAERTVFLTYDAADYQANGANAIALERFDRLKDAVDGTKQAVIRDIDASAAREIQSMEDPGDRLNVSFSQIVEMIKSGGNVYSKLSGGGPQRKALADALSYMDDTLERMSLQGGSNAKQALDIAKNYFKTNKIPLVEDPTLSKIIKRDAAGNYVMDDQAVADQLFRRGDSGRLNRLDKIRASAPDKVAFDEGIQKIILGKIQNIGSDSKGFINLNSLDAFLGDEKLIKKYFNEQGINALNQIKREYKFFNNPDALQLDAEDLNTLLTEADPVLRREAVVAIKTKIAAANRRAAIKANKVIKMIDSPDSRVDLDAEEIMDALPKLKPSQVDTLMSVLPEEVKSKLQVRFRTYILDKARINSTNKAGKDVSNVIISDSGELLNFIKDKKMRNRIVQILGEDSVQDISNIAKVLAAGGELIEAKQLGALRDVRAQVGQRQAQTYNRIVADTSSANILTRLQAIALGSPTFSKLMQQSSDADLIFSNMLPIIISTPELAIQLMEEAGSNPELLNYISENLKEEMASDNLLPGQ